MGRESDLTPTEVGPPRAREIALARTFSVAIADDGTVWRWGASSRTALARVEGIEDAVAIAVGSARACALDRAGDVRCWDDGMNPEPMKELPSKADRLVMGPDLIAAHVADDTWWAWGKAYDSAARSLRPVAPHEMEHSKGAKDVFLASLDVCLITQTSAVSCSDWRDPALHVVLERATTLAGHERVRGDRVGGVVLAPGVLRCASAVRGGAFCSASAPLARVVMRVRRWPDGPRRVRGRSIVGGSHRAERAGTGTNTGTCARSASRGLHPGRQVLPRLRSGPSLRQHLHQRQEVLPCRPRLRLQRRGAVQVERVAVQT